MVDELEFDYIPIWVRVLKMPLGLMIRDNGEAIGNTIGGLLEAEGEGKDLIAGRNTCGSR
jgi:hypothetical protein